MTDLERECLLRPACGKPPAADQPSVPPQLPPLPADNVIPITRAFEILREIVSGRRNGV